ncbi:hypothetical protein PBY51_021489 [Eleginops maclovinus]|uniref:Uncharacterized protein n=1 Tax=Eleginops maclovinus TaxID=56733 RepID=A0AAN8AEQ6_ELEMC|nr:hypothetical protein PBY51_021489 [Eleginops maclovinus]
MSHRVIVSLWCDFSLQDQQVGSTAAKHLHLYEAAVLMFFWGNSINRSDTLTAEQHITAIDGCRPVSFNYGQNNKMQQQQVSRQPLKSAAAYQCLHTCIG